MGILRDKEKNELKELVSSVKIREDLLKIARNRHNPFLVDGKINLDQLLTFLTDYNYFINHIQRPFRKIIDNINRL